MARTVDFDAEVQGAKQAILEAIRGATDMPGEDTFHFIKEGVKEATREWLNENRAQVFEAIKQSLRPE